MESVVIFLDVGQGDCTIVADLVQRAAIVIDCPSGSSQHLVQVLRTLKISGIRLALSTHSHWDHIGGLYEAVRAYHVQEIRFNLDTNFSFNPRERVKLKAALRAFAALEDEGTILGHAYTGSSGQVGDIHWFAVAPTYGQLAEAQILGDPNYSSVIVRLEIGEFRALIAGDADERSWRRVLDRRENLAADVFRLPHHGGDFAPGPNTASLNEILDTINASYHIVSVGTTNTYGHPALSTLESLRARTSRARVMCTEVNTICLGSASLPRTEASQLPPSALVGSGMRPGACPCAGTISFHVKDDGWTVIPDVEAHDRVVDALENPMSRGTQFKPLGEVP